MPTIPQSELPIPKSWDEFEDIVADLYGRLWNDPNTRRYGRTGQPQQGIDVYGCPTHLGGDYAGVQCKRYDEGALTRAIVEGEVGKAEKFSPPLAEYTIATTERRNARLQRAVREISQKRQLEGKFSVHIAFWEDLCSLLTHPDNSDLLRKHYADWLGRLRGMVGFEVAAPSSLHQLPADLADFTGREGEVRELVALLGGGAAGATISAIGGMGGVGKTALAVHVAHRVAAQYPGGQIVVEMGGTSERPLTPVEAMGRVVHAFQPELRLPDDSNEVVALYRTTLEGRRVLLLLDNAANSAQVRPLVVPAGCGLVVTSRHNVSLPGLRHFDLDALPEAEACALLQTIMGQGRATDEELGAIAGLCGRLPLALRVAGDFLVVHPDWSAAEYARELADEWERLARLKHEDLDVGAALGLSAAQLVRERADLAARWQMLSVFPAPFERSAAAAVWGVEEEEARDGLSELAARSLVLYKRESGLYRLHDLMRLVAEDAFGYGGGERDVERERVRLGEVAVRHAAYYLEAGKRGNDLYKQGGEHVLEGLRLFDGAWPHLQAAYGRMRDREDEVALRWASDFPDRVAYVWDLRLLPKDKISILEAATTAAREIGDRQGEGNHLGNLGLAYSALGETRRAIEYYEQALKIAREIGDRRGEGADLGNLGSAYFTLGEVRRAIEYYEQQLIITREIGDRRGEGNALMGLGLAYADLGETRRAIEYYEQALVIAREIGDRRGEGADLGNLGIAYRHLGETRRAIEYYEQALEIDREIGDRRGEGADLGNLGNAYADLGETRRAIEYYEQALAIAREIGDRRMEGNALANLGLLAKGQGDLARARQLWEQALDIYETIEDPNAERVRGWLDELAGGSAP